MQLFHWPPCRLQGMQQSHMIFDTPPEDGYVTLFQIMKQMFSDVGEDEYVQQFLNDVANDPIGFQEEVHTLCRERGLYILPQLRPEKTSSFGTSFKTLQWLEPDRCVVPALQRRIWEVALRYYPELLHVLPQLQPRSLVFRIFPGSNHMDSSLLQAERTKCARPLAYLLLHLRRPMPLATLSVLDVIHEVAEKNRQTFERLQEALLNDVRSVGLLHREVNKEIETVREEETYTLYLRGHHLITVYVVSAKLKNRLCSGGSSNETPPVRYKK